MTFNSPSIRKRQENAMGIVHWVLSKQPFSWPVNSMRGASGCCLEGKHLLPRLNLGIVYLDLRHNLLKNLPS